MILVTVQLMSEDMYHVTFVKVKKQTHFCYQRPGRANETYVCVDASTILICFKKSDITSIEQTRIIHIHK